MTRTGWNRAATMTRGVVALRAHALVTGLAMRDAYGRTAVLETARYPEIRFTIDSLVGVEPGQPARGTAAGTFEFRGVREAIRVPAEGTSSWWISRKRRPPMTAWRSRSCGGRCCWQH